MTVIDRINARMTEGTFNAPYRILAIAKIEQIYQREI